MIIRLLEEFQIDATHGKASVTIRAIIDNEDKITIKFKNGNDHLKFMNSDKNTVKAVAAALEQAADLVDIRKVTAA